MIFTFTAIGYFFSIIAFALFTWRIAKVFIFQRTPFSKFLFLFFLSFLVFFLITFIICLCFASSSSMLRLAIIEAVTLQSLGTIFLARAIFPLIKLAPIFWKLEVGFIVLLTLITEILYWQSKTFPILQPNGFIDWNFPLAVGIMRGTIALSVLGPAFIIFFRQSKCFEKNLKRKIIFFESFFGVTLISAVIFLMLKGTAIGEIVMMVAIFLIMMPLVFWPYHRQK